MNRNVESHFSELPKIDIQRSMFDRSSSHKTAFDCGELIPFFVEEVYPADTFNITTSCVVRLQTPLTPIMDNIYMDTYYFYVPCRILWQHWKEFMGENKGSAWIPQTEYSVPSILTPESGFDVGTIADYMGIPTGVNTAQTGSSGDTYISALPFRAYAMICDEWFRDQNLTDPINISFGDSNIQGSNGSNYITDTQKGGKPFKVAKFHDYLTSCLPSPQKGETVTLMNGVEGDSRFVPVYTRSVDVPGTNTVGLKMKRSDVSYSGNVGYGDSVATNVYPVQFGSAVSTKLLVPTNLWTDLAPMAISVNDLRLSFQLQKFLEKNARAGTRYRELLREHFNVTSSDARMMIPEYLGGHRFPLSIHQVANQSQGEEDFLGDLGAMSNTSDVHEDFVRSFEEHGFVIGVCCVRYDHSYSQALEKFWTRKHKLDYYFPVFQNIGEQPVYKREIMLTNNYVSNDAVFGYQEAYADLRYKPSRVSSEMRPEASNSLATWHLGDFYSTVPSLSDSWIREDLSNVDRVLSVGHTVAKQVFADFYVKNICTRALPMYSIPGLIDHN